MARRQEPACEERTWSGGALYDRSGIYAFMHIVRSITDPAPLSRKDRQVMKGGRAQAAIAWKADLRDATGWKERIAAHLEDGRAVTFNRIVLELTDHAFTADIAHGKAPDNALWDLVTEGAIEHTLEVPILFRSTSAAARLERAKGAF